MNEIKNLIIAAVIAFFVGITAAGGVAVYHYSGKIDAINVAHELDIEKRVNAGLTKSITLATSQNETINRLEQDKAKVIGETNAQNQKLAKSFGDLRSSILAGGLLRDRNAPAAGQTGTAGKDGTAAGNAGADSTGILSRRTSELLLDYATRAETTRLDLIRQKGAADQCVRAYNELVDKYNQATGATK